MVSRRSVWGGYYVVPAVYFGAVMVRYDAADLDAHLRGLRGFLASNPADDWQTRKTFERFGRDLDVMVCSVPEVDERTRKVVALLDRVRQEQPAESVQHVRDTPRR